MTFAILNDAQQVSLFVPSDKTASAKYSATVDGYTKPLSKQSSQISTLAGISLPLCTDGEWRAHGINSGINIAPEWTCRGNSTRYLAIPPSSQFIEAVYEDGRTGHRIPVIPGESYRFCGLWGLHHVNALIRIKAFEDKDSSDVLLMRQAKISSQFNGGKEVSLYDDVSCTIKIPDGANFVEISIVQTSPITDADAKNAYIFFADASFTLLDLTQEPLVVTSEQYLAIWNNNYTRYTGDFLTNSIHKKISNEAAIFSEESGASVCDIQRRSYQGSDSMNCTVTDLNENCIQGWVDAKIPTRVQFFIVIDGNKQFPVTDTWITEEDLDANKTHFSSRLPLEICDGNVHHIALCVYGLGKVYETYEVFNPSLTNFEVMREYAPASLPHHLAPLAQKRYAGLQDHLRSDSDMKQIIYCHDRVLDGFDKNTIFGPLTFPKVSRPDVSIVIPVHNAFNITYHCLCAILLAYNDASFEVIIGDDASTDQTVGLSDLVQNITIVKNEEALGFVGNCNNAASAAKGKYIVFLNNDTEPCTRWLDELVAVFSNFSDVGMVGSKLLYPDGTLQEAGAIIWANGIPWNYGRNGNPADPRYNYVRNTDYISGASLLIDRKIWNKVGGFDEEYSPAYYEDADIAFKVRQLGLKTLYAPHSEVVHFEGKSNGLSEDTDTGMKRFQKINKPKFQKKWVGDYETHGNFGETPDLEKDRGIRGRALFLDYQFPRPDMDAGSYAAIQEMRAMQALGYKITFLPENVAALGNYGSDLGKMGIEAIQAPFAFSLKEFLQNRGDEFDIIYITRYYVAQNCLADIKKYAPNAKTMFCNADLHFLREMRSAILANDSKKLREAEVTKKKEIAVSKQVDLTLSYNTVEHAVITSHTGGKAKVAKCPWVVEVQDKIPTFDSRDGIAFLGGYGHPPNAEATEYFVSEVMPNLRKKNPNIKLYLYGSQMTDRVKSFACDDIIIGGFVDHVSQVYNAHKLFVVPLLTGAGIKGKVLGAASYGIPNILSPVAAEGTGFRHGYDCLIAKSTDSWVDQIASLYEDQEKWESLSNNAREYLREEYSFEQAVDDMRAALEQIDILLPEKVENLTFQKLIL